MSPLFLFGLFIFHISRHYSIIKDTMEKLHNLYSRIKECIPASYTWEVDDRFSTALVQIDINDSETIKKNISAVYNSRWDSSSIHKASQLEKNLAASFFGIKKRQTLFTSHGNDVLFFGAWWPWGDNSRVSLRIGFFSQEKSFF